MTITAQNYIIKKAIEIIEEDITFTDFRALKNNSREAKDEYHKKFITVIKTLRKIHDKVFSETSENLANIALNGLIYEDLLCEHCGNYGATEENEMLCDNCVSLINSGIDSGYPKGH